MPSESRGFDTEFENRPDTYRPPRSRPHPRAGQPARDRGLLRAHVAPDGHRREHGAERAG